MHETKPGLIKLTQYNGEISAILNVTITIKRDILRKNADPLSDNKNQYLKKHYYRKALIKQLI